MTLLDDLIHRFCAGLLICVVTSSAGAWAASANFDLGNIPPRTEAIQKAARHVQTVHCATAECIAVTTINDAFEVIFDSDATTMGATRPLPIARPSRINQLFRVRLLSHPNRFAAICARATDLASQFGIDKDPEPDHFLSIGIIQIAYLMDSTKHGQCLPAVLSAFHPSAAADTSITDARQICAYRHWAKSRCEMIAPQANRQQEVSPVHGRAIRAGQALDWQNLWRHRLGAGD